MPGNGDLLRLAAGNLDTVLGEIFVKHGVQTLFHRCKTVCEACIDQSLLCPVTVIFHAARHIVAQGLADELEILKYHGKYAHVIIIAVLADVDAVEQNLPLLRVYRRHKSLMKVVLPLPFSPTMASLFPTLNLIFTWRSAQMSEPG